MDCYSCVFFNDLYATKSTFVLDIFNKVGPQTSNVLSLALSLWIIAQGFSTILQPDTFTERLKNIVKTGIMALIVALALRVGGGPPLVNQWILDPLEDMGLRWGLTILNTNSYSVQMPSSAMNPYSQFAFIVEQQIFRIIRVPALLLESRSSWLGLLTGQFFLAMIISILLILPYAFIFGLVGAFMLEVMFKFVAIGLVAPILAPAVLFQPSRPFTVAGIRILIGAFFTMVFTGGALAFTMKTVDYYTYKIHKQACDAVQADAAAQAKLSCGTLVVPPNYQDIPNSDKAGELSLLNMNIYMMFIIGFASIILHLQCKALASNISGANDGAGPAAATLAAMKGVAGVGAGFALSGMFGSGGLSQTANQMLRGETMSNVTAGGLKGIGQMLQQHGVGGTAVLGTGNLAGRAFSALRADNSSATPGAGGGAPAFANAASWQQAGGIQRFGTGMQSPGQGANPGSNQGSGPGSVPGSNQVNPGRRNRNG